MIILLFVVPAFQGNSETSLINSNTIEEISSPNTGYELTDGLTKFDNMSQVDIDIVLVGFNNSIINETFLMNNLPLWQAPIERYPTIYQNWDTYQSMLFDVNYTLNYNLIYATEQEKNDYYSFIQTNGTSAEVNYDWPLNIDSKYSREYTETAKYVRPEAVEQYLNTKFSTTSDYTLVVVDTFTGNEQQFVPYYFNNSFGDLDSLDFLGRRYSATNQMAGGSSNSRLLFVDYSAGPNKYADNNNRGHFHITDYNFTIADDVAFLNANISQDITTAIELKFLPSNIYTPIVPKQSVIFEVRVINFEHASTLSGFEAIPTSNIDYYSHFNPDIFVSELSKINPYAEWSVKYLGEWDWYNDPAMVQNVTNSIDIPNEYIDSSPITQYLDEVYSSMFSASNTTHVIVPVWLWGLPGSYGTDFGGVAENINGIFSYFISSSSHDNLLGIEQFGQWGSPNNITNQVQGDSLYGGYLEGYYQSDIIETTVVVNSGDNVTIELLDGANYMKSLDGAPYQVVASYTNLSPSGSPYKFNISATDILNAFWWKMSNTGVSLASYDVSRIRYSYIKTGFTRVSIHEAGHGIGVSHPHDGFSWKLLDIQDYVNNYGEYIDWLWDSSYTTMSYAQSTPGFSILDIDAVQRGFIPDYLHEIFNRTEIIKTELSTFSIIPGTIYNSFIEIETVYNQSIIDFHELNYLSSISKLMGIFSLLDSLELDITQTSNDVSLQILNTEYYDGSVISYFVKLGDLNLTGTYTESVFQVNGISWDILEIGVSIDNIKVIHYLGYTWDGAIVLSLPIPNSVTPSSSPGSSTTPQTSTTEPSKTSPSHSSDDSNNSNGFVGFNAVWGIFGISFVILIPKIRKK